jgi:hypothetical protein
MNFALFLLAYLLFQATVPDLLEVEERAILQAVVDDLHVIELFGGRRMQLTRMTELPGLHPWVVEPAARLAIRLYDTAETLMAPAALVEKTKARNHRAITVRRLRIPPRRPRDPKIHPYTEKWERMSLSRPGVSEDGLSALVAITRSDRALAGFSVYLEKREGMWRVVGETAASWVV